MAKKKSQSSESQSSASATELAQALTKALQKNTAPLGVARALPLVQVTSDAINEYIEISADLETLLLPR